MWFVYLCCLMISELLKYIFELIMMVGIRILGIYKCILLCIIVLFCNNVVVCEDNFVSIVL